MKRLLRTGGGFALGFAMGLPAGAIIGFAVFLSMMCAPYSGCRTW